eukprot:TRINITY_DN19790_c0_g1_i2.p1 TRINITY_DN19790_c0_g1~~TRINITY_DN19790_c0_g1_i2.p1  ORF type:complete len:2121 (+),score=335.45 TRINITY_DN19790_c0_g1_i2:71-6364(+)
MEGVAVSGPRVQRLSVMFAGDEDAFTSNPFNPPQRVRSGGLGADARRLSAVGGGTRRASALRVGGTGVLRRPTLTVSNSNPAIVRSSSAGSMSAGDADSSSDVSGAKGARRVSFFGSSDPASGSPRGADLIPVSQMQQRRPMPISTQRRVSALVDADSVSQPTPTVLLGSRAGSMRRRRGSALRGRRESDSSSSSHGSQPANRLSQMPTATAGLRGTARVKAQLRMARLFRPQQQSALSPPAARLRNQGMRKTDTFRQDAFATRTDTFRRDGTRPAHRTDTFRTDVFRTDTFRREATETFRKTRDESFRRRIPDDGFVAFGRSSIFSSASPRGHALLLESPSCRSTRAGDAPVTQCMLQFAQQVPGYTAPKADGENEAQISVGFRKLSVMPLREEPELVQRVTLRSRATNELMSGRDVQEIVDQSIPKNRENGITSFLVWMKPDFVQTLEGPGHAVRALLSSIRNDPRHEYVEVLDFVAEGPRLFGNPLLYANVRKFPDLKEIEQLRNSIGAVMSLDVMSPRSTADLPSAGATEEDLLSMRAPTDFLGDYAAPEDDDDLRVAPLPADPRLVILSKLDPLLQPFVTVCILYNCLLVPVLLGGDQPVSVGFAIFHLSVLSIWWAQVAVNIWRPKEREGVVDTTPGSAWRLYFRSSRCIWEIAAGFPLVLVGVVHHHVAGDVTSPFRGADGALHPVWFANQLLLVRFLDGMIVRVLTGFNVTPRVVRIIQCFILFAFACHLMSCLWLLLMLYEGHETSSAWHGLEQIWWQPLHEQYPLAFDQTVKQMSGMAKAGKAMPRTDLQLCFASCAALVGVTLYATVIATIGSLVTERVSEAEMLWDRLDKAYDVFRYYRLPEEFVKECKGYLVHVSQQQRKLVSIMDVLGDLHVSIAISIERLVGGQSIKKLPMFAEATGDARFLHFMLSGLEPQCVCMGEEVMRKGEEGSEMFFLVSGRMGVINERDEMIAELGPNDFFGEIAVLNTCRRTATIRALCHCSCWRLGLEVFREAEELFPEAIASVRQHAWDRLQAIKLAEVVESTPLFSEFATDTDFVSAIVGLMKPQGFPAGCAVIEEGQVGHEMYFVSKGLLRIGDDGGEGHLFHPGDYFGEISLIYNLRSNVSVYAHQYSDLFTLDRSDFESLTDRFPSQCNVMQQIAREAFQRCVLGGIMEKVPLFDPQRVTLECREEILSLLRPVNLDTGAVLCSEGESAGALYIVSKGRLDATVKGVKFIRFEEQSFFGDGCLFLEQEVQMTVEALMPSELFVLAKADFDTHIKGVFARDVQEMEDMSRKRVLASQLKAAVLEEPLFARVRDSLAFIEAILSELHMVDASPGEEILAEGEPGGQMIFVHEGSLEILRCDGQTETIEAGASYGDLLLTHSMPSPDTVRVPQSGPVSLFRLSADSFQKVRARFPELQHEIKCTITEVFEPRFLNVSVSRVTMLREATRANPAFLQALVESLTTTHISAGRVIVSGGAEGSDMYLIGSGEAVLSGTNETLVDGSTFSEDVLMYSAARQRRTVTAQGVGGTSLYVLSRTTFFALEQRFRDEMAMVKETARKLYEDDVIIAMLRSVGLFESIPYATGFLTALAGKLTRMPLEPLKSAFNRGELGQWLGLVLHGSLGSFSGTQDGEAGPPLPQGRRDVVTGGSLRPGDAVGDMNVLFTTTRQSTVTARVQSELLILTQDAYAEVAERFPMEADEVMQMAICQFPTQNLATHLSKSCLFSKLDHAAVTALATSMRPRGAVPTAPMQNNELGRVQPELWVMTSGQMRLHYHDESLEDEACGVGEIIGATEVFYPAPRAYVAQALVPSEFYVLTAQSVEAVLSGHPMRSHVRDIARREFLLTIMPNVLAQSPLFRCIPDASAIQDSTLTRQTSLRYAFCDAATKCIQYDSIQQCSVVAARADGVDRLFYTLSGRQEVLMDGLVSETLTSGMLSCECGLLSDDTISPSTIIAAEDSEVLYLTKLDFDQLLLEHPRAAGAITRHTPQLIEAAAAKRWSPFPPVSKDSGIGGVARMLTSSKFGGGTRTLSVASRQSAHRPSSSGAESSARARMAAAAVLCSCTHRHLRFYFFSRLKQNAFLKSARPMQYAAEEVQSECSGT